MIIKPKKCKNCAKLFTPSRSTMERVCSAKCAIEFNQSKLLVKGTPEFKAAKIEVKIGENRRELQKNINLLSRMIDSSFGFTTCIAVSYTHLTLPTIHVECRSRWSPYH